MFDTAWCHSLGGKALSTNMSITTSALLSGKSGGSEGEDKSHTDAVILPTGGERYNSLFYGSIWSGYETTSPKANQYLTCTNLTACEE